MMTVPPKKKCGCCSQMGIFKRREAETKEIYRIVMVMLAMKKPGLPGLFHQDATYNCRDMAK